MNWPFILRVSRWLAILGPFLWVAHIVSLWNYGYHGNVPNDTMAYWLAGEAIHAHGTPYLPVPPPGPHHFMAGALYLYPPPFASVLSFMDLPPFALYNLIICIATIGVLALAAGLLRLARVRGLLPVAALAGLLYFYAPTPHLILHGNIQYAIDAVTVWGLLAGPFGAGVLLASAAVVKVTPVWALGVVLVRCGRGALVGASMAIGAAAAVSIAALGASGFIDACATWLTQVAPTLAQGQFESRFVWMTWNVAPSFLPLYALAPWPDGVELPGFLRLYLSAVQFGVPAFVVWRTRHLPWNEQAGWVLVAATLSAPILRAGYLPILLLAPVLWWRGKEQRDQAADHSRDRGGAAARPADRMEQLPKRSLRGLLAE